MSPSRGRSPRGRAGREPTRRSATRLEQLVMESTWWADAAEPYRGLIEPGLGLPDLRRLARADAGEGARSARDRRGAVHGRGMLRLRVRGDDSAARLRRTWAATTRTSTTRTTTNTRVQAGAGVLHRLRERYRSRSADRRYRRPPFQAGETRIRADARRWLRRRGAAGAFRQQRLETRTGSIRAAPRSMPPRGEGPRSTSGTCEDQPWPHGVLPG